MMVHGVEKLLALLGPEIEDVEEGVFLHVAEAFLLFAQSIPSSNLGFVDAKATELDLTINGQDLTITQSPAVLSSNRAGGTTGAVVWKITPLFASWLASPNTNIFFKSGVLSPSSAVLELGCGVSALVGLAVGPLVRRYILSDQSYVARFVEQNLTQNRRVISSFSSSANKSSSSSRKSKASSTSSSVGGGTAAGRNNNNRGGSGGDNITFQPLDWEFDRPDHSLASDMVIACDCIYNDALIPPFVQTCVDTCKLKGRSSEDDGGEVRPCICVVAQQLRDPEIFEAWLREFSAAGFRVWRLLDEELPDGLKSSSGFVVHVGILRESTG